MTGFFNGKHHYLGDVAEDIEDVLSRKISSKKIINEELKNIKMELNQLCDRLIELDSFLSDEMSEKMYETYLKKRKDKK